VSAARRPVLVLYCAALPGRLDLFWGSSSGEPRSSMHITLFSSHKRKAQTPRSRWCGAVVLGASLEPRTETGPGPAPGTHSDTCPVFVQPSSLAPPMSWGGVSSIQYPASNLAYYTTAPASTFDRDHSRIPARLRCTACSPRLFPSSARKRQPDNTPYSTKAAATLREVENIPAASKPA
jgi:hypothetical protein